jgi:hypothetical protein
MTALSYEAPAIDLESESAVMEHIGQLPLAYDLLAACGAKGNVIRAVLHCAGEDPAELGMVHSYIPDLSAEGIQAAYENDSAMRISVPPRPLSFMGRLALVGTAEEVIRRELVFQDARFSQARDGEDVVVEPVVPPLGETRNMRWPIDDSGQQQMYLCNHMAALWRGRVIDPGYDKARTLSIGEWKALQQFPDAVVMSFSGIPDAAPWKIHTEHLSDTARQRFVETAKNNELPVSEGLDAVVHAMGADAETYQHFMLQFFNLRGVLPTGEAYQRGPSRLLRLVRAHVVGRNLTRRRLSNRQNACG